MKNQKEKQYLIVIEFYHRSIDSHFFERKVFYYDDWESTKEKYLNTINKFLEDQEQVGSVKVYKCNKVSNYNVIMKSVFN